MNLTAPQERTLRNLIASHYKVSADKWNDAALNLWRGRTVDDARDGDLTHEQSLILAAFGVAMLEPRT